MADWSDDPDVHAWLEDAQEKLAPMVAESALSVTMIGKSEPDAKLAVELGFSILLDKPIIVVCPPGATVPAKLLQIAERVLVVEPSTSEGQEQLRAFFTSEEFTRIVERAAGRE